MPKYLSYSELPDVKEPLTALDMMPRDSYDDEKEKYNDQELTNFLNTLPHPHAIKILNLNGNRITDAGVVFLINKLPNLIYLNLQGNKITDQTAIFLTNHPKLKQLHLGQSVITDTAAIVLANNTNLIHLNIAGTDIGDTGIIALANNFSLKVLDLGNVDATTAGLAAFENNQSLVKFKFDSYSHPSFREFKELSFLKHPTVTALDILILTLLEDGTLYEKAKLHCKTNQQRAKEARKNFVAVALQWFLGRYDSNSIVSRLPNEILRHILSFFNFSAMEKTRRQGIQCAQLICDNLATIKMQAHAKKPIKIIEKPFYPGYSAFLESSFQLSSSTSTSTSKRPSDGETEQVLSKKIKSEALKA